MNEWMNGQTVWQVDERSRVMKFLIIKKKIFDGLNLKRLFQMLKTPWTTKKKNQLKKMSKTSWTTKLKGVGVL